MVRSLADRTFQLRSVLDALVDEVAAELRTMQLPTAFQLPLQSSRSKEQKTEDKQKTEELIREVARAMQELVEEPGVAPVSR